jgi:Flp pilus assembly protein TadB
MIEALVAIVVLFAGAQFYAMQLERKRAIDRERELLAAVLSKNIGEYLQAVEKLRKSPKDSIMEMKLENELARAAVALEESQGIPVR